MPKPGTLTARCERDEAHIGFNQLVNTDTIQHFLYRDYPDDLNTQKLTEQSKQFTIKEITKATKT